MAEIMSKCLSKASTRKRVGGEGIIYTPFAGKSGCGDNIIVPYMVIEIYGYRSHHL